MESGGYAMSMGNRFQDLWAVRQILLVVAEENLSVRVEPAGVPGEGLDLIVALPNGRTEYQQCKRTSGQTGKWTLATLDAKGVLLALRTHLTADRAATFRLVSVDPAPDLRELAESARSSLDPQSFYRDQVANSSKRRAAFERFCKALSLDASTAQDSADARELLERTYVSQVGDDEETLRELGSLARPWIDCPDPHRVIKTLESWAGQTLRRAITADVVTAFLRSRSLQPRILANDSRILPAIERLQERFELSLRPQLIGDQLFARDETDQILHLLDDENGPRFIAIHGGAGVGKSGVLFDLVDRLRGRGTPFLPLRLDRQRPTGSSRQYGASLDLPESPTLCLNALSGGHPAVLILDQLDALRWTGSNAAQALDICRELVSEALRHPHIRLVASCRTFDLESDPQIRSWVDHQQACKLQVDRLSENRTQDFVSQLGVDPSNLTTRQLNLLRTIQHLRSWEQILKATNTTVSFETERDLLQKFWESRQLEARKMGLDIQAFQGAVDEIVDYMDRNGVLVAPDRLLHGHTNESEALRSLNVIAVSDNKVSFCHQTYLDYQLAHALLRRIDEQAISLKEWLIGSTQELFRREQLRIVLAMLRDESVSRSTVEIQRLIDSPEVRFHLKQLALQFLGQLQDPSSEELDVVFGLLEESSWQRHIFPEVLVGHSPWFEAAADRGLVDRWLEGEPFQDRALWLIRTVIEENGDRCCTFLGPLAERNSDWQLRVMNALPLAPANDSAALFELRLRLIKSRVDCRHIDWSNLGGTNLPRLVRLLTAIIDSTIDTDMQRQPDDLLLHDLPEADVDDCRLDDLLSGWKTLIPQAARVIGVGFTEDPRQLLVGDKGWREYLRIFLCRIAAALVSREACPLSDLVIAGDDGLSALLLLQSLSTVKSTQGADDALGWLEANPDYLRLRWHRSDLPWKISTEAVRDLTERCSPVVAQRFEQYLLDFKETSLRQAMQRRHERLVNPYDDEPRFANRCLALPSTHGQTAYHLLPCLPDNRLTTAGKSRLRELRRKFSGLSDAFFAGSSLGQGGAIGSPLDTETLGRVSDRAWLEIITRNVESARGQLPWRFRNGRFEESSPEAFARDLQTATAQEPGRFARLAVYLPQETSPLYLQAILHGLRAEKSDKDKEGDATTEEIEAVLNLPYVRTNPTFAIIIAWLIESRADLNWSGASLKYLATTALEHPDPSTDDENSLNVAARGSATKKEADNLLFTALNTTRGAALVVISKLILADPSRWPYFEGLIDRAAADPHPAVRAAALRLCTALLEKEPDAALEAAMKAVEGSEALKACGWFDSFLYYLSRRFPKQAIPILRGLLASKTGEVVQIAAAHTVALNLLTGDMRNEALSCLEGSDEQRVGAAEVAAAFAGSPDCGANALRILLALINSAESAVLEKCARVFSQNDLEAIAKDLEFLSLYSASAAFRHHPFSLLNKLRDYPKSLVPFAPCILALCQNLARGLTDDPYQRQSAGVELYLPPILLRLYEEAPNNSRVRQSCLDSWDLLLNARVISALNLTESREAG